MTCFNLGSVTKKKKNTAVISLLSSSFHKGIWLKLTRNDKGKTFWEMYFYFWLSWTQYNSTTIYPVNLTFLYLYINHTYHNS